MRSLSGFFLGLLLSTHAVFAGGHQDINAQRVKTLLDSGSALVVNPLSPIEFDHEHIPGSVNIPLKLLAQRLPADKSQPLVFYCLGEKCVYSWRAADHAEHLGYTNVFAFRGGIPEWKAAGHPTTSTLKLPDFPVKKMSTKDLARILERDDLILLDINDEEDAGRFWIDSPKRVYIPLDDLRERYTELSRDRKIVIVCLRGERGPIAVRFLMAKGFKDVGHLQGGLEKWVFEGRPTRRSR
jgi:rhodanese-related sulfurtransferase